MNNRTWEWIKEDPIQAGALAGALVATAHAEYTLATATHVNAFVAGAVPVALDLYVIRALMKRRDVLAAVLAMVAANVASHLIVAGVLEVKWQVISAVGAVAPLVLWRVYSLQHNRTRSVLPWRKAVPEEASAVSAPVLETSTVRVHLAECPGTHPDHLLCSEYVTEKTQANEYVHSLAWAPGYHLDGCDGLHLAVGPISCSERASALASECRCTQGYDAQGRPTVGRTCSEHTALEEAVGPGDYVPDWMTEEYPASAPVLEPSEPPSARHLSALPDLPPEYAPSAVHSESPLKDTDLRFLEGAQEYVDNAANPSVRGLMKALNVGQDRAGRLLEHLGVL